MMIFRLCKRLIIKCRYNYALDFYNYAAQTGAKLRNEE